MVAARNAFFRLMKPLRTRREINIKMKTHIYTTSFDLAIWLQDMADRNGNENGNIKELSATHIQDTSCRSAEQIKSHTHDCTFPQISFAVTPQDIAFVA